MNPKLARGLSALRRRMLGLGAAAGIGWGLAAVIVLFIAWMWLDLVLDFAGAVRAAAAVLSIFCGLALVVAAVVLTIRQGTPGALARRLDTVANTGQYL